jgi:hypothetical protein
MHDPRRPATLVRAASPLLAIFYLAAMFERVLGYITIHRHALLASSASVRGSRAAGK